MHSLDLSINVCYSRAIRSCDIGNFVGIPLYFLSIFTLCSNAYINFHEYVNETAGTYYR